MHVLGVEKLLANDIKPDYRLVQLYDSYYTFIGETYWRKNRYYSLIFRLPRKILLMMRLKKNWTLMKQEGYSDSTLAREL